MNVKKKDLRISTFCWCEDTEIKKIQFLRENPNQKLEKNMGKKLLEIDLKLIELNKNKVKYELYQKHVILNTHVKDIFPLKL